MKAIRPFNTQLNPGSVYARAALGAPLPGGSFNSRINALRAQTLFDPGTNQALAQQVRNQYGFDDTAIRNVTQTIGTAVGATLGFKKGLSISAPILKASTAGGLWGTVGGVIAGVLITTGTTLSSAYTGYAIGGTVSPSGLVASGELIRDVVIGMKTDALQTATYVGVQAATTIISNKIVGKFKFDNKVLKRLMAGYMGQVATQRITTATGLIDSIDPDRMNLLALSGATQAQYTGANAIRGALTGIGTDESIENIKKAYGISSEGYQSYTFADVRSSFGVDLGIMSGQFVDFIGNTLTDPSFWNQQILNRSKKSATDDIAKNINKEFLSKEAQNILGDKTDTKYFSNFVIDNIDNLDSVETYNLFLKMFGPKYLLGMNGEQRANLYNEIMNSALDALSVEDLSHYSMFRTNKETAKGFQKMMEEEGVTNLDNELTNQFASLNLKTSGRDFNMAVATYSMAKYYDNQLTTLAQVAGWTDPFEKFIYSSQNIMTNFIRNQKAIRNKNSLTSENLRSGLYSYDPDKVKAYLEDRYLKSKSDYEAFAEQKERLREKAAIAKQNSPEAIEYERLRLEYEGMYNLAQEYKNNIEELRNSQKYTETFQDDNGKKHTINESNRNVKGQELERLEKKPNKTQEDKLDIVNLKSALESFDVNYSNNYMDAESKYYVRQLKSVNKIMRESYDAFSAQVKSEFELRLANNEDDEFEISMPGDVRFKRDVISIFHVSKDKADEVYNYYLKGINPEALPEDIGRMINVMNNSADNYGETKYRKENYHSATRYTRSIYVEEQLKKNPLFTALKETAQNVLDEIKGYIAENSSDNYEQPFDLIADPLQREAMAVAISRELDKFNTGLLKDIFQGIERVFDPEAKSYFGVDLNSELIEKLGDDFDDEFITNKIVYSQETINAVMEEIVRVRDITSNKIEKRQDAITILNRLRQVPDTQTKKLVESYLQIVIQGIDNSDIEQELDRIDELQSNLGSAVSDGERVGVSYDSPEIQEQREALNQSFIERQDAVLQMVSDIINAFPDEDLTALILNGLTEPLSALEEALLNDENNIKRAEELFVELSTKDSPISEVNLKDMALNTDAIFSANTDINNQLVSIMGLEEKYNSDDFRKGASLKSIIENRALDRKDRTFTREVSLEDSKTIREDLYKDTGLWLTNLNEVPMDIILQDLKQVFWVLDSHVNPTYDDGSPIPEDRRMPYEEDSLQERFDALKADNEVVIDIIDWITNGSGSDQVRDFDPLKIGELESILLSVESAITDYTEVTKHTLGHTNVIKETANYKLQVASASGIEETTIGDFIFDYGSKSEIKRFILELNKVYDKGIINGPFSKIMENMELDGTLPTKEEVLNIINTVNIKNQKYDNAFNNINSIRKDVSAKFNKIKMQNNTPLFEAMMTPDIIEIINALDDTLNYGKMWEATSGSRNNLSHLNELLKVDTSKSEMIEQFKKKSGNLRFKMDFLNGFKTKHNLNDADTLKMMDFVARIQNVDFFSYSADDTKSSKGFLMDTGTVNFILDTYMNSKYFKDLPFLKDLKLEINNMRDDILNRELEGTESRFKNMNLKQSYDASFADGLKNILQNQMTAYISARQDKGYSAKNDNGTYTFTPFDETDPIQGRLSLLSEKAMAVGTLISTINGPLSRQGNRNTLLLDTVYTDDFHVKNILKQDTEFDIDERIFKHYYPNQTAPTDPYDLRYYRKGQEEWLRIEDNRFNLSSLINNASALSIVRPNVARDISAEKRKQNVYYNTSNLNVFSDDGDYTERGVEYNQTLVDRNVNQALNSVFSGLFHKLKLNIKDNDVMIRSMYYDTVASFTEGRNNDEFAISRERYDDYNGEYFFNADQIDTLIKPANFQNINTIDEEIVKAAIGKVMSVLSNPVEKDFEFFTQEKSYNERTKEEITKLKDKIASIQGRYENEVHDLFTYVGNGKLEMVPTHQVIYNILDNVAEEDLDSYMAELGLDPLTEEDLEFRRSGLELDYKNPPPFLRQLMNFKEKQVTQFELKLDELDKQFQLQIDDIKESIGKIDPEEANKYIRLINIEKGKAKNALLEAESEILNLDTGETSTVYYTEWIKEGSLAGKLEKAKLERDAAYELIQEELDDKITDLEKEYDSNSRLKKDKFNGIKEDIMDKIRTENTEGLIKALLETYPNQSDFIRNKVNELQASYNDKKSKIVTKKLKFKEVVIYDDEGNPYNHSVPEVLVTSGSSIELIDKILNDSSVPAQLKEQIISGNAPDFIREYEEKYSKTREVVREDARYEYIENGRFRTTKDLFEYYSKILGLEEYGQLVAKYDRDYQQELRSIEYDMNQELFDFIMTIEDNMWNYGVGDNKEISYENMEYQSNTRRANQLSNYFSASFADVAKLYTNTNGFIDYEAIRKHFINDPSLQLVTIGVGSENARDSKFNTGKEVVEVKANKDTPVIKVLESYTDDDIKELIQLTEEGYQVGFMTEPMYELANSVSYKAYKLPKGLDKFYNATVKAHKMSAIFDSAFVPEVLTSTIMSNMVMADGVIDEDTALRYGVQAYKLYNTWNQVQQERMMDMQELLQLEHDLGDTENAGAKAQYQNIKNGLIELAETNETIASLVNGIKYGNAKDNVRSIYFMLNSLNNAEYADVFMRRTSMYQNNLFTNSENQTDRVLSNKNIDVSNLDLAMLSETHNFMTANGVDKDRDKIHKAMGDFVNKNPHLQISEEHMRWLYFQNPEAKHTKGFLNPNNVTTYHLSAANSINTVGMLHGYLIGKHLYGDDLDRGVARALDTHFSFKQQSRNEILTSFMFPYMNTASHNVSYWGSMFNRSSFQRVSYNLMISAWGGWNNKYNPDRDNDYARRMMTQGMVPVGENDFLKVGMQREIFKSFNLAQNPGVGLSNRMNPVLKYALSKVGVGREQSPVSAIPFVGRMSDYVTGFKDRQGMSKYSPSLFGYMHTYQKRNYAPYRNIYKQTYDAKGKYRTPSNNALYNVKSIQYRMKERRYLK